MTLTHIDESAEKDLIVHRQQTRESAARTYARHFPIVPVRAQGMVITGADGRQYLDCLSGAGTLALGHNHPVVREAIQRTLDSGAPLHTLDIATPQKDEFTNTLLATLPDTFAKNARIHFCGPSGADAVEAALKLTQTATGRHGVLAFTGAYHGMTLGSLAVSGGRAAKTPVAGLSADVTRLPFPYSYRCPFGIGGAEGAAIAATYTQRILEDPNAGVVSPAAMIVEPVQGEGGVIPSPDNWLRAMRQLTTKHAIPLIVDEVQTGAGRTGSMWGFNHSGIQPDVVVASKAIGGGLPLAVIIYNKELDVWRPGAHAGTFRGNVLAMATGTATLRHIQALDLVNRAHTLGEYLLDQFRALKARYPIIGDVRGRGLMLGLELIEPTANTPEPAAAPDRARVVRQECLDRGLIVELGGRHDSVVRILPPLTITDVEVESVLSRLDEALLVASEKE